MCAIKYFKFLVFFSLTVYRCLFVVILNIQHLHFPKVVVRGLVEAVFELVDIRVGTFRVKDH